MEQSSVSCAKIDNTDFSYPSFADPVVLTINDSLMENLEG